MKLTRTQLALARPGRHQPDGAYGPWRVIFHGGVWCVVSVWSGKGKGIGFSRSKDINYFDRAMEEAKRRSEGRK